MTRLLPAEVGIAGMRFPESYTAQLTAPFLFKRLYVEAG